jgi:ribosome modulation factor
MKSIKQQYIDLNEGRMSQSNFMRSLRMTMPHLVTNVTSFKDSVRILKNKGILSEVDIRENNEISDVYNELGHLDPFKMGASDYEEGKSLEDCPFDDSHRSELWKNGWNKKAQQDNKMFENIKLNEAKQNEKTGAYDQDGASMYKGFSEDTHVNRQELTKGIKMEHEQNPYEEYKKIVAKVIKNLKKDPNYYTHYSLSGIPGFVPQVIGNVKPSDRTMKFVKGGDMVDKAMGMKPVKDVEKVKASSNKAHKEIHPNKIGKTGSMSLIAKTVRGLQKMNATGEKYKKIKLKESQNINWDTISEKDAKSVVDYHERTGRFPYDLTPEKYQEILKKYNLTNLQEVDINNLPEEENNEIVNHAAQFINNNSALKSLPGKITLHNGPDNTAILKYDYWDVLPEEAFDKLEMQFEVESSNDKDEDTGEIISYILKSKKSPYGGINLGDSFGRFKDELAEMVFEELQEIFDGRDNMSYTAGDMTETDIYGIAGNPEEEMAARMARKPMGKYEPLNKMAARNIELDDMLDDAVNNMDWLVGQVKDDTTLGAALINRARKTNPSLVPGLKQALNLYNN